MSFLHVLNMHSAVEALEYEKFTKMMARKFWPKFFFFIIVRLGKSFTHNTTKILINEAHCRLDLSYLFSVSLSEAEENVSIWTILLCEIY